MRESGNTARGPYVVTEQSYDLAPHNEARLLPIMTECASKTPAVEVGGIILSYPDGSARLLATVTGDATLVRPPCYSYCYLEQELTDSSAYIEFHSHPKWATEFSEQDIKRNRHVIDHIRGYLAWSPSHRVQSMQQSDQRYFVYNYVVNPDPRWTTDVYTRSGVCLTVHSQLDAIIGRILAEPDLQRRLIGKLCQLGQSQ